MIKRFTSLTLLWSFVVLFISSLVLFTEPHGRVAFWSNWQFLGLTKGQWDDLHLCSGTLFSVTALIHLYLNWKMILAYLKKKIRGDAAVWGSFALTLFVCISSYLQLPPMKQLIELEEKIKQTQTQKYGNPPFGHAELVPINKLAKFLGIDPEKFVNALKANKIPVASGKESLKELSGRTGKSPSELFHLAIESLKKNIKGPRENTVIHLPSVPPPGTGMMTIDDIARTYHVSRQKLLERLKASNIDASPTETIKEIAKRTKKSPPEIYGILSHSKIQN